MRSAALPVTTIELRGLELHGYHGALDEEASEGQRFLFDIWLGGRPARSGDRIEDAVDYREVAGCVREVSDATRFQLLESLAAAVADALLARFPARMARVAVRKPEVRLDPPVEHAAVTVERP